MLRETPKEKSKEQRQSGDTQMMVKVGGSVDIHEGPRSPAISHPVILGSRGREVEMFLLP